ELVPGSRRERYRVHNEVWYEAVAGKDRRLERCERSLRHGLDGGGRDSPAGQRIAETIAVFEFLPTELPPVMKGWQQRPGKDSVRGESSRRAQCRRAESAGKRTRREGRPAPFDARAN